VDVVFSYFAEFIPHLIFWLVVLVSVALVSSALNWGAEVVRPVWFQRWPWLNQWRLPAALFGHMLIALGTVVVAQTIFDRYKIEPATHKICTSEPLSIIVRDLGVAGANPILVHVRDGIGTAQLDKPLLSDYITMRPEGEKWCGNVRYARKSGFAFKIFIEARKEIKEELLDDVIKHLRQNAEFAPQAAPTSIPDGRCRTIDLLQGHRDKGAEINWNKDAKKIREIYVTKDRIPPDGPWRVWVLLQDYICILEDLGGISYGTPVWNNFFQPSASVYGR
jgi:hypothetical protein